VQVELNETVAVKSGDSYAVIRKGDFDPAVHELYVEASSPGPGSPTASDPSSPSGPATGDKETSAPDSKPADGADHKKSKGGKK
jgi:hypothetical protein